MAFSEGNEDNISQPMGSTGHRDDFQEALNMISEDNDDKAKVKRSKIVFAIIISIFLL